MITRSTKKTLLTGTSAIALITLSAVSMPSQAFAVTDWGNIVAVQTNNQYTEAATSTLSVTGAGDIIENDNHSAVVNANADGSTITVNTSGGGSATRGIESSGGANSSAITIGTGGSLATLTLTSGQITGAGDATHAAVNINGDAEASGVIGTSSGTLISSSGAGAAILIGGTAQNNYTITNAGTISNTSTGDAIDIASKASSTLAVTNTGSISSASGNAINIGALTVGNITNTSGTIGGNIILGNAATSTLAVNGGTITGNVLMNNALQTTTLGGGQIVGKIDGLGLVVDSAGYTSSGNIGSGTGITKLTVNDGITFNAATNNNSIQATNVVLGSAGGGGATLKLGTGVVTGAIDGDQNGKGVLDFTASQALAASSAIGATHALANITISDGAVVDDSVNNNAIKATNITLGTAGGGTAELKLGTGVVTGSIDGDQNGKGILDFTANQTLAAASAIGATHALATINISDGVTVDDTANNVIKATHIVLGNSTGVGSTLKLGTAAVTGSIDGKVANQGIVDFTASQTTGGTIGAATGIAAINISDGATVVAANNMKAVTTTVGAGASGVLTLNSGVAVTGNVVLASGSTLNQHVDTTAATISGTVNGSSAGNGTYNIIGGSGTFATNNTIGGTSLLAFTTGDGITANLTNNINATSTTFGGGASGIVNQSAGIITATTTNIGAGATFNQTGTGKIAGALSLGSGATFAVSGAGALGVTGTIDGSADNLGAITIATNTFTNASAIGATHALSAITVNSGGVFDEGANVKANTITVNTGGTLNFGTTAHTTVGAITGVGTGIINLGTASQTETGTFTTAAANTIDVKLNTASANANGKLTATNVSFATNTNVAVDTSAVTGFIANGTKYEYLVGTGADTNATSHVTANNGSIVLSFTDDHSVSGQRDLVANRVSYGALANTPNGQAIGNALNAVIANPDIIAFQNRLDQSTTVAQLNNALKEVTPQVNVMGVQAINLTGMSADIVDNRMGELRAGIDSSSNGMAAGGHVSEKGVWLQGFGTKATQDYRDGVDGYDAKTGGVAVGADGMVADYTRLGASFSYANTSVDSNSTASQKTDIDSYQGNLYGSYTKGSWYTDGLVGVAFEQYDGDRIITSPAYDANAKYDGEVYTARAGGGYRFVAANGLDITPNTSLTYYYDHTQGYTESGAGGLDLKVGANNSDALIGRIGTDIGYTMQSGSMSIRPVIRAGYMYDFIGDQASTTALFTGGGASFNVKNASPARNAYDVGASLNLGTSNNVKISADYDYSAKSGYDSQSGVLRARLNF